MRIAILGTVAGLILGTMGALAYSHYVSDQQLAELQAQLDAANAKLAKTNQDRQQLASETSSVSDQIDALQASNDDLKKQLAEAKAAPAPVAPPPEINPLTLSETMRGLMRGGFQNQGQRLFLLQTRLHLTPEQANAIKAAMQADARTRGEIMRQMFGGGRGGRGGGGGPGGGGPGGGGPGGGPGGAPGTVDPALAAKANTLDQTLSTVLTPQQRIAYQQVQAEEQAARVDTQVVAQINQMAPLLQLTDQQKDQMSQQLYQAQMQTPDPTTLITNPNAPSIITKQAQATDQALAKVLSPQQMDLYQQAGQAASQSGFGGRRGNNGANGTNTAAGSAPAAGSGTAAATTAAAGGNVPATTTTATDGTNAAASTNAASATNAAASTTASNNADGSTNATAQPTSPQ